MATRLTTSRLYGHLWGTAETDALFDEPAMLQRWLDILVALARAQEPQGIVPAGTADRRSPSVPGWRRSTSTSSPSRRARPRTRRWA